jgi:aspartate dehydrogenase
MKKVIAIIGCGAIGSALAGHISEKMDRYVSRQVLYDVDAAAAEVLAKKIGASQIARDMEEAAEKSDVIVEASQKSAVPELLRTAVEKGRDIMIMSIGGLMGEEGLLDQARERGISVMLPSGAIAGIDAVKAARIAGIDSVTLTTRKSPASLKGAPYLAENNVDLDSIKKETVIFDGNALEAIKGFPKNVNVSALLSIAGIGAEKTKVKIVTSSEYTSNIHEISIESKAGRFTFRTENVPFPSNPKTSYLAALSAMATLEEYFDAIKVGS